MKKLALILFLAAGTITTAVAQQNCETLVKTCEKIMKGKNNSFVSDGQVYTALLDRESAEFKTTFYGGSTYRIAATAGTEDAFVIFTVTDLENNVIFTNKNYKNAEYWDFKVPSTIPVIVRTELDPDKKVTGCAVMMIGFKR